MGSSNSKISQSKQHHEDMPKQKAPTEFLDLPPELRIIVYEMALVNRSTIVIAYTNRGLDRQQSRGTIDTPGLLTVSRQIHAEASAVLYGRNRFILSNGTCRKKHRSAEKWTTAIGKHNINLLSFVTWEQDWWSFDDDGEDEDDFFACFFKLAGARRLRIFRSCSAK